MAKVKFEREDNVAIITMSDPATLNAIDTEMSDELKAAFTRACDEARCVLLTGEGRAFSSGANLNAPRTAVDEQGRIDVGERLLAEIPGILGHGSPRLRHASRRAMAMTRGRPAGGARHESGVVGAASLCRASLCTIIVQRRNPRARTRRRACRRP